MKVSMLRRSICLMVAAVLSVGLLRPAEAQLKRGFVGTIEAQATGSELNAQSNLWVMDVTYKPLRMIRVNVTDPKTGKPSETTELVWYFIYKAVNRELIQREGEQDLFPVNTEDPPFRPYFVPEFTLVSDDNGVQTTYHDEIHPEIQKAIMRRERMVLKNSVEVVQELPPAVPPGEEPKDPIFGVAIWRNVSPDVDYCRLFMSGFSNGYKYVRGPVSFAKLQEMAQSGELRKSDTVWNASTLLDAKAQCDQAEAAAGSTNTEDADWQIAGSIESLFDPTKNAPADTESPVWMYTVTRDRFTQDNQPEIWRKTIQLTYSRRGDEFSQSEKEFRRCGDPQWIFRPSGKNPAVAGSTGASGTAVQARAAEAAVSTN